jgi:uncharacterized protein GlcG (DUF336 family)
MQEDAPDGTPGTQILQHVIGNQNQVWIQWDLNPQPPVCKTGALPVRATNPCVAGVVGVEPTQIGLEDRCPRHAHKLVTSAGFVACFREAVSATSSL